MQYDFSHSDLNFQTFIDAYTSCVTTHPSDITVASIKLYEKVFTLLQREFHEDELLVIYEELAAYKIANEIPYAIMSNEIYSLKNMIISCHDKGYADINILDLLHLFSNISNRVAHIYLLDYIEKLTTLNKIRIDSIESLVEQDIMLHYEAHLVWLTDLAIHIKDTNKNNYPQLDSTMCEFGLWLHHDAKNLITDKSRYKSILKIHQQLHLFASKIYAVLCKGEYAMLITYLEKCELISLNIGTELALIDQLLTNKKVALDILTGALSRNGLNSIFENQYELSLATNNSFVIAMCDLDFFKKINDNYGHVAGDKILKHFVDIVKENTRNSDIIIRYGGEEFFMILPTLNKEKGYAVLDKIRQEFADTTLEFENEKIPTTVSIGMLAIKPTEFFKMDLINNYLISADKNLYLAKDKGRNRVEC